jgi:hypothetical protein
VYYIYYEAMAHSLYNESSGVYYICKGIDVYIILWNISSFNDNDNNNVSGNNIFEENMFLLLLGVSMLLLQFSHTSS